MWSRSSPGTGFRTSTDDPARAVFRRDLRIHGGLFGAEALAVALLYAVAVPILVDLISHLGAKVELAPGSVLAIVGLSAVQQACYWRRLRSGAMRWPWRSAVLGHLFRFAGRTSFFFGGALFSSIFYRHVPQLEMLPPLGQIAGKVTLVLAVLFCLFCFSLELDRIGTDLEKGPVGSR